MSLADLDAFLDDALNMLERRDWIVSRDRMEDQDIAATSDDGVRTKPWTVVVRRCMWFHMPLYQWFPGQLDRTREARPVETKGFVPAAKRQPSKRIVGQVLGYVPNGTVSSIV